MGRRGIYFWLGIWTEEVNNWWWGRGMHKIVERFRQPIIFVSSEVVLCWYALFLWLFLAVKWEKTEKGWPTVWRLSEARWGKQHVSTNIYKNVQEGSNFLLTLTLLLMNFARNKRQIMCLNFSKRLFAYIFWSADINLQQLGPIMYMLETILSCGSLNHAGSVNSLNSSLSCSWWMHAVETLLGLNVRIFSLRAKTPLKTLSLNC